MNPMILACMTVAAVTVVGVAMAMRNRRARTKQK
jgi:hypothetical protein